MQHLSFKAVPSANVLDGIPEQSQPKTESETEQSAVNPDDCCIVGALAEGGSRVNASEKCGPGTTRAQLLSELNRAIDEAQWLASKGATPWRWSFTFGSK
jgi:hypothetical protein